MKKMGIVGVIAVIILVAGAFPAHAFSGTRAEAITSINKALESPEISAWVNKKFGSVDIFKKAVGMAPEDTVRQIAQTFNDFQQNGGDMETAAEALTWTSTILMIGAAICVIILIAML
jgi:hypothetical protein